ncbi:hypothetical protein PILCRDRAFT_810262 [Piloderma croceum F 1598]|uniref:Uncharacterized protein n=1 Tax=Piloderma croceum (strain F 1598) TaxID=765440 RepID=A0A0C3GNW1_PILCF|nr:hypothetical protein PILCRDRAFT_810262 [Piloderma croceum F 1598]
MSQRSSQSRNCAAVRGGLRLLHKGGFCIELSQDRLWGFGFHQGSSRTTYTCLTFTQSRHNQFI